MTTGLRKLDKFTPSQNPYWFCTADVLAGAEHPRVMWASRKNGRTVVTLGTYMLFPRGHGAALPNPSAGAQAIIEATDTRYGGSWLYRWDGQRFQENPTAPVRTPGELEQIRAELDRTLHDLLSSMSRPDWDGPYYKVEVDR